MVRLDVFAEEPPGGPRTWLAVAPLRPVPDEYRERGVGVTLGDLRRRDPRIKEARFVLDRRPFPLAERLAYEDLLLDDAGRIVEGSSSNVYALLGDRLVTAREEALPGITQGIVLELAAEAGLEAELRPITTEEMARADEAFLTSSTRGLVGIVQVGERTVGEGVPGPRTRALWQAYRERVQREARRADEGPVRPRA